MLLLPILAFMIIVIMVPSVYAFHHSDTTWEEYDDKYEAKISDNMRELFIQYNIHNPFRLAFGFITYTDDTVEFPVTYLDVCFDVDFAYTPDPDSSPVYCMSRDLVNNETYEKSGYVIQKYDYQSYWSDKESSEDIPVIFEETVLEISERNEMWIVQFIYDARLSEEIPTLESEIDEFIESFSPIGCKLSTTQISIDGEIQPERGQTYTYNISINDALDSRVYWHTLGKDVYGTSDENSKLTFPNEFQFSGKNYSGEIEIRFSSMAFNKGDSEIVVQNGCLRESLAIQILGEGEKPISEIETTHSQIIIPKWIKNNAGWWADGQIDDNSFVQGIEYLVKLGIIRVS